MGYGWHERVSCVVFRVVLRRSIPSRGSATSRSRSPNSLKVRGVVRPWCATLCPCVSLRLVCRPELAGDSRGALERARRILQGEGAQWWRLTTGPRIRRQCCGVQAYADANGRNKLLRADFRILCLILGAPCPGGIKARMREVPSVMH